MTITPPVATETPTASGANRLLLLFLLVFALCCVAAMALPHSTYIRFQQVATSSMRPGVWIYERIEFDRTPIDVAIIGASRTETGISGPKLQAALSSRLGRPIGVANLSMPADGRDLHYEIAKRLIEAHPEVKLILLSLTEHPSRTGHPAFRSLGDTRDVLAGPKLINPGYLDDVTYLPYRQLSLFAQSQMPSLFGVRSAFDPAAYWGTGYDSTHSYWSANGRFVDREAIYPPAVLSAQARGKVSQRTRVFLPPWARDYEYAIERHYTRALDALAREHGVRIGFVYLPVYAHAAPISDLSFYAARGVVFDASFVANRSDAYSDYAHLNRRGSEQVTAWLAERLGGMAESGRMPLAPEPTRQ
ncbi:MAG: hypothetical protein ABW182_12140 [Sphingomonas sp.]